MLRYILPRLGQGALVLFAAYTCGFAILYLLPSDPAEIMAAGGEGENVDPTRLAAFRSEYGLDRPVLVQYFDKLSGVFRGDLGTSISSGRPVTDVLAEALPATLGLALVTLIVSIVAGVALSLLVTNVRSARIREWFAALPNIWLSIPTFCTGLVLLQLVSFRLGWLPAFGGTGPSSLVLPVITLGLPAAALVARLLTKGIENERSQRYVSTLRAKGVPPQRIFFAHILRNACLPALTAAALLVGELFAGSIVVEVVFSRPGLGRIAIASVVSRDLPVVLGLVLCGATVFVAINVLVDLLYPLLDPRIVNARGRTR